ncbi:hypothetical protein [Caldisericum sp.]|jgi:hypothetical protein|uniref:hypothetical protein n=1 Tax=Caldisericum sp. TaxID=2499687 RepID=UPI003D134236
MRKLIILFLIIAPLVDYSYSLKFILGSFEISPNRIFKFLPLIILVYSLPLIRQKLFLWKWLFLLFGLSTLGWINGLISFPYDATDSYIRFLSSFVFVILAGKILDKQDLLTIFKFLFLITLIPIMLSYLQFSGIIPYTDFDTIGGLQIGRVSGGYEKQVAMVSYLIGGFSFALFQFFNVNALSKKFIFLFYIILVFGVIILSTHRASLLVFIIIFFYFIFKYWKRNTVNFLVSCLLIAFVVFAILNNFDKLKLLYATSLSLEIGSGSLLRGRTGFWLDYINNLFYSGVYYVFIGKGHSVLDVYSGQYLPLMFNEPHSDLIRILHLYGIIGLFVFLFIIFTMIKISLIFRKYANTIPDRFIGDMGIVIGISLFLYSITIEPTRYPSFWWYYSVIISYILVNFKRLSYENRINN